MTCPNCKNTILTTKVGHLCLECGFAEWHDQAAPRLKPHGELVHNEKRVEVPSEPGEGKVDTISDKTAFTADSNSTYGAFTWIQVDIGRFSYYAIVFVLVVIIAGVGYHYFEQGSHERATSKCGSSLSETSAGGANADALSPGNPEKCKP